MKIQLYSDDVCNLERMEEAKELLISEYEIPEDEITDERIFDFLGNENDIWWDDLQDELTEITKNVEGYVSWGSSMNWYRGQSVNTVWQFHDLRNSYYWDHKTNSYKYSTKTIVTAIDTLIDGYNGSIQGVDIEDDNGLFIVTLKHHDANDTYRFREITQRGVDLYDRWYDDASPRLNNLGEDEILQKIVESSNYSRLPRIAQKLGYTTRKAV